MAFPREPLERVSEELRREAWTLVGHVELDESLTIECRDPSERVGAAMATATISASEAPIVRDLADGLADSIGRLAVSETISS